MAKAPKTPQDNPRISPGESSNRPIVLVALELEARGLNAIIPGADVVVCGPGREGIRRWADANPRPGRPVIMSGLGGGIDHALPRNSVVVARDVYNPHGPTLTSPLAPAITEPNLPRARFTSSLRTVASTAAKADLHRTSGAGVVDMESVPFSSIAHQHKWRWGIVRVISEPADTTLPTAVDNWVDHKGRTRNFAVIRDMIQRPTILSQIRGIRERSQEAIEHLAQALAQIKLEDGRVAEPVPEVLRRQILLFGGTFDPPHRAHVDMPFEVARRIGCTDVVYVPANVNPLKVDTPPTSPKHRLEMLRRALAGKSGAKISRCELERPAPSYMVDTLEILRKELRGKDGTLPRIRLMMGSDQALQFTKWHEWKRILDYATPVVVLRPPYTRNSFARALADRDGDDLQARSWLSWTLDLVPDDISSQEIRKRIIAGEDVSDMIPPSVIEYITKHRLYQPAAPQPQSAPSPPPSTESTPRNMPEPGPRSGKDEEPHDRYSPFS